MDELEIIGRGLAEELSLVVDTVVKNRNGTIIMQVSEGDEKFALKVSTSQQTDPDMPSPAEQTRQEAMVSRTLPPGPWLNVQGSGEYEAHAYLLTPWVTGLSSTLYLVSFPPPERAEKFREVVALSLAALHSLHRAGTVHCDIQPEHLIMDEDHTVYLIDFGSAARLGDRDAPAYRGGLPHFMPPEVARDVLRTGRATRTIQGDVYSLAASLAFAYSQEYLPPYKDNPSQMVLEDMMKVVAEGKLKEVTGPDHDMCRLLNACLAPDPRDRPDIAPILGK